MIVLLAQALAFEAGDGLFDLFEGTRTQLVVLLVLVPVAVAVLYFGNRQLRQRGGDGLRPKGRTLRDADVRSTPEWRRTVGRLESKPATPIADAKRGPVRLQGELVASDGSLGGPADRAIVWRNRAGARPDSAVAVSVVILADSTGRCGIEGLEAARVIAPTEKHSIHVETVSLRLGDRVEVYGYFEPESPGEPGDRPQELVYGTLGGNGLLEVRLLSRPTETIAQPDGPQPPPSSTDAPDEEYHP